MVVARPRVTPTASVAENWTLAPMRVATVRPRAAEADPDDRRVIAVTGEIVKGGGFGLYLTCHGALIDFADHANWTRLAHFARSVLALLHGSSSSS
jgi:hypothetical protein